MKINFVSKSFLVSLVVILSLTGCNLPTSQDITPTTDLLATEVSRLLTEQPAEVLPDPGQTPSPAPTESPTTTLSPVPTPSKEPTLTATTNPGDPRQTYGEPTWTDSLSSAKNFFKDENDHTKIAAGDGTLQLTGKTVDGWRGWSLTYSQNPANFYLEGTFRIQTCSGEDIYGLVFRAGKENTGYFLGFTCDGQYELRASNYTNGTDTEVIGLKSSSAIIAGSNQVNRIGLLAQGDKFTLYANGTLLEEISDPTFLSGYIGAFIAAYNTPNFTAELDEISVWRFE